MPKQAGRQASTAGGKAADREADKVVTSINSAKVKRGGRQDSIGYDPATQEENYARGSREEFEAFRVDERGSQYRADRFYTRSVNSDGHGEKMSIRVPQGLDSQMHKAVAEIPQYHTMHDLIRDAVVHRLHYLQHQHVHDPEMQALLDIEALKADDHRQDEIVRGFKDAIQALDDSRRFVWESDDIGAFAEKLDRGSLLADKMRPPWGAQASEMLKGWRVKSAERVKKWRADQERKAES